eukprot:7216913-Alexandrium_andersonii.AAC.1
MARLARRLAGYARPHAHEGTYRVALIALSEAMGYLGVPAGAVVRAVGSFILDTQGRVQWLVSQNTHIPGEVALVFLADPIPLPDDEAAP